MKYLITGIEGFVGKWLYNYLDHDDTYGFDLRNGNDITDYEQVRSCLDFIRPDYIFHLAAQPYVPESFTSPKRAIDVNTIGTLNILEACRQLGIRPKILLVGTSEEYGDANGVVTEETVPTPISPYGVSKLAATTLGRVYHRTYGLHVVSVRPGNQTGPNKQGGYADTGFAKQVAEIEIGRRKSLEHGNLSSIRSYTDVRDIVRAYKMAIDLEPGIYNICSDNRVAIMDVLKGLLKHSKVSIPIKDNDNLSRKNDFDMPVMSCEKFKKLTGWEPEMSFDTMMKDLLEDWRTRVVR